MIAACERLVPDHTAFTAQVATIRIVSALQSADLLPDSFCHCLPPVNPPAFTNVVAMAKPSVVAAVLLVVTVFAALFGPSTAQVTRPHLRSLMHRVMHRVMHQLVHYSP